MPTLSAVVTGLETILIVFLTGALVWFVLRPPYTRWRHRVTLEKIVKLVKDLPVIATNHLISTNPDATQELIRLYEYHPTWVDEGFSIVSDAITADIENAQRIVADPQVPAETRSHWAAVAERHRLAWKAHQQCNGVFYHFITPPSRPKHSA